MLTAKLIYHCNKFLFVTGKEQLDKAREVIKKLKDEKSNAVEEMSAKIKAAEQGLEEERENLMQELKRGKSAALNLMQVIITVTWMDTYLIPAFCCYHF